MRSLLLPLNLKNCVFRPDKKPSQPQRAHGCMRARPRAPRAVLIRFWGGWARRGARAPRNLESFRDSGSRVGVRAAHIGHRDHQPILGKYCPGTHGCAGEKTRLRAVNPAPPPSPRHARRGTCACAHKPRGSRSACRCAIFTPRKTRALVRHWARRARHGGSPLVPVPVGTTHLASQGRSASSHLALALLAPLGNLGVF